MHTKYILNVVIYRHFLELKNIVRSIFSGDAIFQKQEEIVFLKIYGLNHVKQNTASSFPRINAAAMALGKLTRFPFFVAILPFAIIADILSLASEVIPTALKGFTDLFGLKSEVLTNIAEISKVPFKLAESIFLFAIVALAAASQIIPTVFNKFMGLFDTSFASRTNTDEQQYSHGLEEEKEEFSLADNSPSAITAAFDNAKQQSTEQPTLNKFTVNTNLIPNENSHGNDLEGEEEFTLVAQKPPVMTAVFDHAQQQSNEATAYNPSCLDPEEKEDMSPPRSRSWSSLSAHD